MSEDTRLEMCVKIADFAKKISRDETLLKARKSMLKDIEKECNQQRRPLQENHLREIACMQTEIQKLQEQLQTERAHANQAIQ